MWPAYARQSTCHVSRAHLAPVPEESPLLQQPLTLPLLRLWQSEVQTAVRRLCDLDQAMLQDVPPQVAAAGAALCESVAGNMTAASSSQLCQAAQHFAVTGTLGWGAGIDVNASVDQNAGAAVGLSWQLASTQSADVSLQSRSYSSSNSVILFAAS